MLGFSLLQIACSVGAMWFGAKTATAMGRDLRAAIFDRVQAFSTREVGRFGAPSLLTRTTNDVLQVQMLTLMAFTMMVAAPFMMVGGIVLALRQDATLSWLLVAIVPALAVAIGMIIMRMGPLFRIVQKRIDRINLVMREQITGIRVIRAFVKDGQERERFGTANEELFGVSLAVGKLMAMMFPVVMLVVNIASVGVLWFGGHRIDSGGMKIGALTAFLSYLMQILMAIMMSTFMLMMWPRAAVCAERINEVLDTECSVVLPAAPPPYGGPGPAGAARGGLPLSRRRGVGAEGRQLHRAARRDHGHHRLDRQRQDHAAQPDPPAVRRDRRRGAGRRRGRARAGPGPAHRGDRDRPAEAVPVHRDGGLQPALRHARTPRRTSCGTPWRSRRPATSSRRCRRAWTPRSPRAAPTSPAASASAWRSPGPWCTSRRSTCSTTPSRLWTTRTDARLRAALVDETRDSTVVIVAQRVSTIRNADRIIVLDQGVIVGTGTHSELMDSNETYREIVLSQLTEEEAVA